MNRKILFLLLLILISNLSIKLSADTQIAFGVDISNNEPAKGEEVSITINLKNYFDATDDIRGLQVDIKEIDPDFLEVISHESLIVDDQAISNKTSENQNNHYLRYVFAKMSGILNKETVDVARFVLKIKNNAEINQIIELPVTYSVVTTTDKIVLNGTITLTVSEEHAVRSINITWGEMKFEYDDGTWDSSQHVWKGAGWKSINNSNTIKVENDGDLDAKIKLSYQADTGYSDIQGTFTDSEKEYDGDWVDLNTEQILLYWFNLSGKTEERWDDFRKIGSISIELGE